LDVCFLCLFSSQQAFCEVANKRGPKLDRAKPKSSWHRLDFSAYEGLLTTREDAYADLEGEEVDEHEDDGVIEVETAPEETQRTNGKVVEMDASWAGLRHEAVELVQRSRVLLDRMHAEDQQEAVSLQDAIEKAVAAHDSRALGEAVRSLKELLFFVEGA